MFVVTRLRIGKTRPFFSVGSVELLEKIEHYTSIKKATEAMKMSYTKALKMLRSMEREFGFPLVVSEKGGNDRGMTRLTEKGKQVLTTYQEVDAQVSAYAKKLVEEKFTFPDA
ncbi:MAG: LysR family transcriptional regulator [Peptococcaceae bacterium]|nr:LysR family transcriptional regulator [Peptococcaceae bacterium]